APRQEVPVSGGGGPTIALNVALFLAGGDLRRLLRIDADGDDVELFADGEVHLLEGGDHRLGLQDAGAGGFIEDHVQDDRLLPEKIAEADGLAVVIREGGVQRDLRVQFLVYADRRGVRRGVRRGRDLRACGDSRRRHQPDGHYGSAQRAHR